MSIIGQNLLHYRILEKIGEGGMGAVFKAEDTHLDRIVAIKVLPHDKMEDPERRQRFVQEAKSASSLNHPHIIVVHDITADRGIDFMVMEYVEGRTLDQLIGRRGMKLNDSLGIAMQIADGMAKAHGAGIIHRDLKPRNIMVTEEGQVKILDFGLAKLAERKEKGIPSGPTMTAGKEEKPLTEEGYILGTAAYMSPEQAEGKIIDTRSDIFSFGSVFYEMLTGRRAFQRESRMATLAAILREDLPLSPKTDEALPEEIKKILVRCLRKDPQRRWQNMSDLKVVLQDLKEDSESGKLLAVSAPKKENKRAALWAVPVIFAAAAAVLFALLIINPRDSMEFEIMPLTFDSGITAVPSISADGSLIAYHSDREGSRTYDIWIQHVSGGKPLRRTDHPADDWFPSLSPDGSRIVFRSERDGGGIYITDALGGMEQKIIDRGYWPRFSPDGRFISYITMPAVEDSTLVRMYLVSSKGGEPRPFHPDFCLHFSSQGATPVWSPDGENLLFRGRRLDDPSSIDWWVAPVSGGEPVRTHAVEKLALTSINEWPSAWSGNFVYFTSGTTLEGVNIYRVPINSANWEIQGPPEPLTAGPGMKFNASVSNNGRVAFSDMKTVIDVWGVEARPDEAIIMSKPRVMTADRWQKFDPSISENGKKLAFEAFSGVQAAGCELRVRNLETGQEMTIPTQAKTFGFMPRLSPDGEVLAYRDNVSDSRRQLMLPFSSQTGREICDSCVVYDFFPDNDHVLIKRSLEKLHKMNLQTKEAWPVAAAANGSIIDASVSTDGEWISFLSQASDGLGKIFVSPIDGAAAIEKNILVIEDHRFLSRPDWSPDGHYLYFLSQKTDRYAIHAQKLDSATKNPAGPSQEIFFFPDSRFHMNFPLGNGRIGVAENRIIFHVDEISGNIYLAEPKSD